MRRYIVLLLITGIVWAQTDFDTLVLKNGTTYFGEYSKIEGKIVFFKPQDAFAFQPVPVKLIQTLKLKDGHFIIEDGKNSLIFDSLILKSGIAYFGEYSKIEEEIVYFKPQNAFAFQPISIKQIQTLELKDGRFIIGGESSNKGKYFLFCCILAVVFIVGIGGSSWRCVEGCGGGGGYVPGDTVPIQ